MSTGKKKTTSDINKDGKQQKLNSMKDTRTLRGVKKKACGIDFSGHLRLLNAARPLRAK